MSIPKAYRFYSQKTLARAKELRDKDTNAEKLLWYYLRNRQLNNYKFRRQHPINKYIVDFVCLEKKFIIELDGGQHNEKDKLVHDNERTIFLSKQGYRITRFWNEDVFYHIEDVLNTILHDIEQLS